MVEGTTSSPLLLRQWSDGNKAGGLCLSVIRGDMHGTSSRCFKLRVDSIRPRSQKKQLEVADRAEKHIYDLQMKGVDDQTIHSSCRWRLQTTDESAVPLSINCWPSASGRDSYVNIEYESTATFDLQDVTIAIPLPALASPPRVKNVRPALSIQFLSLRVLWIPEEGGGGGAWVCVTLCVRMCSASLCRSLEQAFHAVS